jgi:flagellar FliL protein
MAENEPKAEAKAGGAKKWIIIGAVAVLLLAGIGVGAYLFLAGGDKKPADDAAASTEMPMVKAVGPMITFDTFVVNILDEAGPRYLKAALTLECKSDIVSQNVELRRAQLMDAMLLLIGSKTYDELRDVQGKLQLRAELLHKLNELVPGGGVEHIYFTDFVVQ